MRRKTKEEGHRAKFSISKYGHKFDIIVQEPVVVATMRNGFRGIAKCNKVGGDNFLVPYGVRLAVSRAFLNYYTNSVREMHKIVDREETFMHEALNGLSMEMEKILQNSKVEVKN